MREAQHLSPIFPFFCLAAFTIIQALAQAALIYSSSHLSFQQFVVPNVCFLALRMQNGRSGKFKAILVQAARTSQYITSLPNGG